MLNISKEQSFIKEWEGRNEASKLLNNLRVKTGDQEQEERNETRDSSWNWVSCHPPWLPSVNLNTSAQGRVPGSRLSWGYKAIWNCIEDPDLFPFLTPSLTSYHPKQGRRDWGGKEHPSFPISISPCLPQYATLLTSPQALLSHHWAARSHSGPGETGVSPQSCVGSSHDLRQSKTVLYIVCVCVCMCVRISICLCVSSCLCLSLSQHPLPLAFPLNPYPSIFLPLHFSSPSE